MPHAQVDAFSLQGRNALITGGASGMGRAAALLFAAQGAHVVIADKSGDQAEGVVSEILAAGGSASAHAVDLLDAAALDRFIATFITEHDVLDVLYHHAGITGPVFFDYDSASFTRCMTINVWVPMLLVQQFLPLLRRSKAASIIVTSSQAGLKGVPPFPTYAASKAAINQYIKSIALLLAAEGIRANTICPGATDTPAMHHDLENGVLTATLEQVAATVPMGRLGLPKDMAHAALFLASDASAFMTGCTLPVDGGASA